MSRSRKILSILGALVVVGGVVGTAVYYFTRGVADTATEFFTAIAASGPEAAYRKTSSAFQQAMSERDFIAFVERAGLNRFKSASWPSREIQSGKGTLNGTIVLNEDVSLPAKVELTKNAEGTWQVFNFTLQLPGAHADSPQPQRITSTTQSGDEVGARLGDRSWTARGSSIIALKLGSAILVNTAPIVDPQSHDVDLTTLRLQFDADASGTQALGRRCQQNAPCLELNTGDSHYKIDDNATLAITKRDDRRIEGVVSARMVSLEGKIAVENGHFSVTVKQ